MNSTTQDRRRHARIVARGLASHLRTQQHSMSGLAVENISMSGLFVRSATALPRGTALSLLLVRPGLKRAIQIAGRVVSQVSAAEARQRGSVAGMGIELDAPDGETAQRLHALLMDLAGAAPVLRRAA
jgi:hypothetical protein